MRRFVGRLCVAFICLTGCAASVPDSAPDAARSGNSGLLGAVANPDTPAVSRAALSKPKAKDKPLARASLAGGSVIVTELDGYCIDPTTLVTRLERGFAVLASCNILSGGDVGDYVEPMIVTVTVGPRGSAGDLPSPAALALSSGAKLLDGQQGDGHVRARLEGGGDAAVSANDARHWRSAFTVSGRTVGLAMYVPKNSTLAGSDGGKMIDRVRTSILKASAEKTPGPVPGAPQMAVPNGPGILGRLFNR